MSRTVPHDLPLVLVPGILCNDTVWLPQRAALGDIAEVRIADHGMLDTLPAMAQNILASAPPKFAIAGHSMGGRVALEVFRAAPERVLGMALMDTGHHALPRGDAGEREAAGRYALLNKARTQGMRAMALDWVQGMVLARHLSDRALLDAILDMVASRTPDHYAAQIHALLERPDATALLPAIRCPTLVLCGDDDLWAPVERHREMATVIRGSTFAGIPECGHMSTMESPDAVNQAMRTWVLSILQSLGNDAGGIPARPVAARAAT